MYRLSILYKCLTFIHQLKHNKSNLRKSWEKIVIIYCNSGNKNLKLLGKSGEKKLSSFSEEWELKSKTAKEILRKKLASFTGIVGFQT